MNTRSLDTTVYREEVPLTQWALTIIALFITVLTPIILLESLAIHRDPWSLPLYLTLDLIFITITLNFRKLVITIDSEYLTASFGLIKKRIKLTQITTCEPVNTTLTVYTGIGIRYGGDGSLAYLPTLGTAVKLNYQHNRPFVFSTKNQEQILTILRRK